MASKRSKSKTTGNVEQAYREYKDIEVDYRFVPGIMSEDDERVAAVKYIINHKLTQVEKTIILLYTDCLSYRKLGKRLGFSHMTMYEEVKRIKTKILAEYEKIKQK